MNCSIPGFTVYHQLPAATAAAAKSLQSCLTLWYSIDGSPPRLPSSWDSPGKNTGVSCCFLLHCMKVKSESEVAQSCPSLSDPMDCSLPGSSVHRIFQSRVLEWVAIAFSYQLPSLLKFMPIESVMPSNHLILWHPLLLPPSIFPNIRVFSNESALYIRWPKFQSSSFSISPSNEYSGLISSTMDSLDLLAVEGTLKSLLQHHSLKASILLCSAFFVVLISHPYMTTGKTIALTRQTLLAK